MRRFTIHDPEPAPYVSVFGMVGARDSLHDVEMYRERLFEVKNETHNREKQFQKIYRNFIEKYLYKNEILIPPDVIEDDPFQVVVYEDETVNMEDCLDDTYSESTENSSKMDIPNPRANEFESNNIFLQQSDEPEEIEEIRIGLKELQKERAFLQKNFPPKIYTESTETPSPMNTATNSRASNLDNGRTNKNPAKRTREEREVITTPTCISTRIKKPRMIYEK